MLNQTAEELRVVTGTKRHGTAWFAMLGIFWLGCPGVEPMQTGTGASGGAGGSNAGGQGGTGTDTGGTGGTGGAGAGGMSTGGAGGCEDSDPTNATDPANCGQCGRACGLQGVEEAFCKNGRCRPKCDSTHVDIVSDTGDEEDKGCETEGRRVFVTSVADMPPVPFAGTSAADDTCAEFAADTNLGGQWKAWLSDENSSPDPDFTKSTVPYRILNGMVVAASFEALTAVEGNNNQLQHPINMTEQAVFLPDDPSPFYPVWTGTAPDGTATDSNCEDWMTTEANTLGTFGLATQTNASWTLNQNKQNSCLQLQARLYCFEQ